MWKYLTKKKKLLQKHPSSVLHSVKTVKAPITMVTRTEAA